MSRYVEIKPASNSATTYIAANLREPDVTEFRATFGQLDYSAVMLAATDRSWPFAYTAWVAEQPVFLFGVLSTPEHPHIGVAWGMGTNKAKRAIPGVTRFITQQMIPMLRDRGIRRVEVRAIKSNDFATRWIAEALGAEFEGELPEFGFQGETFLQFAWTKRKFHV